MPAYLIARVEISDPERYSIYTAVSPGVVEKFGGRFVVSGGDVVTLEGPESAARWIVVEFSSAEAARKFYDSPIIRPHERSGPGRPKRSLLFWKATSLFRVRAKHLDSRSRWDRACV